MPNVADINSLKTFREKLEPHGIKIWSSSESLPEEVLQQLIISEEDTNPAQPARAEELHPAQDISILDSSVSELAITHFVDGSPRTVNVGFLLGANGVSYPAALAHVGASSVSFTEDRWCETGFEDKRLILASLEQGMGLNIQLTGRWQLEDPLSNLTDINVTDTVALRGAAVRRARRRMRNCEKDLVRRLARTHQDEWIVVDGTLFDVEGYSDLKELKVIGISKSFTLNPIVIRGNKQERIGYLTEILNNLPVGSRSPVYQLTPEMDRPEKYTYMWFVRIHEPRQSPISGIVKVELPPADAFLDLTTRLQIINALCFSIFRLRTPYLYDNRRGESFLYPVYVAETLIKSKLTSIEQLRGIWESSQF